MGTDPIYRSAAKDKWGPSPLILAVLAGAATVIAFAPLGFFPIAIFTFGVLTQLWARATPRRAFALGFWFGLGMFGAGVSWVYVSLHRFGGMPAPLAALATALFCMLLALFPAVSGWLQARIPARPALRACLLIPAAWTLTEWMRSWFLTGFPWLSTGYASVGWPLQGFAPLLGVFGLTFLTLSLAGMLWSIALGRRLVLIVPFIAVLALGQALRAVRWSEPYGAPFSASLVQGNVPQDLKFRPERYARTLDTYARLVMSSPAKLIVLPETALPAFYDSIDPDYLGRLAAHARENDGDIVFGVPLRAPGEFYNGVVSLGVDPTQVYLKRHLVPFGEFVPPAFGWVLDVLHIPLSDFSRGAARQNPISAAGQRLAVNICYEDAFGDEIATQLPRATVLVNVSNVAWFGDSLAPSQHLQIARMRAVETARMHLAATNTGISAAIDRDGRVIARLPQFVEGRLDVVAHGYSGATPYVRYTDWPVVAASVLVLAIGALVARHSASR